MSTEPVSRISKLLEALYEGRYSLPLNNAANFISPELIKQSITFNKQLIENTPNFFIGELNNIPPVQVESDLFLRLPYHQTIFEYMNDSNKVRIFTLCTDLNQSGPHRDALMHRLPKKLLETIAIHANTLLLYRNHDEQYIVGNYSCPFLIGVTDSGHIQTTMLIPEELNTPAAMEKYKEYEIADLHSLIASAVYFTLALLHSQNITTETIKPEPALVKSRQKKGKIPLLPYKVLSVKKTAKTFDDSNSRPLREEKRASPCLHTRRGHIRRIHGGNTLIWIDQMLVGHGPHSIKKDYRLIF